MDSLPTPVYSASSFIGFILVLVPFYWHRTHRRWNIGACCYIAWTALQCLNLFVNSVVWNHNAINWAPLWCDISIRITLAVNVAIPAASLCINRRLFWIANAKGAVLTDKAAKRRAVIVDLCMCVGIPILQIILAYIVQGHRFDIFEDIGCFPFIYLTPLSFPLVYAWPLVISLVSAGYCVATLHSFVRLQTNLNKILGEDTSLSRSRYYRLMALTSMELLFGLPLSSYSLYLNASSRVEPFVSWASTHCHYDRADQVPSFVWKSNHTMAVSLELSRWSPVACALLFFAFFGLAGEALKNYRDGFNFVVRRCRFLPQSARKCVLVLKCSPCR
ncbi:hypothetical protein JAAARDRAFT_143398 [Jaapia argillacea MUCL 33604]|uniref:Fungal pheromone STE3G-protein-coupled receptor n=1 Tax=Jaapia argillacea MUCL 33604 TaxID=933084 RepID=A0A067PG94_9AGAM|nr:hypothetical protein JAAARDRAFT_143398 [Jaapia argillacea MUCL 33604]